MTLLFLFLGLLASSVTAFRLAVEGKCGDGYKICLPHGTSGNSEDIVHLYQNLADSVDSTSKERDIILKRSVLEATSDTTLCCVESMQCLLLNVDKVPFCWDRFTTNVYFADGWYGSISNGNFTSPSGNQVNLITGEYANGSGNVYSAGSRARPNTAAMSLPAPWTSKGVGSALPASILGAQATYTVTIPGTTRSESIIPAETIAATTVDGVSIPATTRPASTVDGTTVPAQVTTVTEAPGTTQTHRAAAARFYQDLIPALLTASIMIFVSIS